MISVERAKEIGDYVTQYGFDVTLGKYGFSEDTLNRYMRLYRKSSNEVPKESYDVKTVQDALLYANTDTIPNMEIKKVVVNTYGSMDNPNKQVKVELQPTANKLDLQKVVEDFRKELATYTVPTNYTVPPHHEPTGQMLVIAMPDLHHGLHTWAAETGQDYDIKISVDRFLNAIQRFAIHAQYNRVDKIMLVLNGDILNSDGITNATTGGTKQSDDSRWQKVFTTAWKMIRDGVEYCKKIADVEVVITQGNHDSSQSYYLGEVLTAWFANDRHVFVDNRPIHYKYKKHGNSLIGMSHGDGSKQEQLPLIMATDEPELWAATKHRFFLIGHFHAASSKGFQTESEKPGCTVIVCPALSSASDWTVKKGYRSIPEATGFLFDKDKGRIATYHYRVDTIDK